MHPCTPANAPSAYNTNNSLFSFQDLTALLRTMGQNPTDSEVNDMINEVDVDGVGTLHFEEFLAFVKRLTRNRGDPENELREAYRRYSLFPIISTPLIIVKALVF